MLRIILVISAFLCVVQGADWKQARLTHYNSYCDCCDDPDADQEECDKYSCCKYQGDFAFCGHKSKSEVKKSNIVSFYTESDDMDMYKGKTLEIKQGSKKIKAKVCDTCGNDDCGGCCTDNLQGEDYLVDMEINTYKRFKGEDGIVQFRCLDC